MVGFEELMHNKNEQTPDHFGRMKRSSHQEFQFPGGTLGSLIVKDRETGVQFKIGSGFTAEQRNEIWANRKNWENQLVKYKWQKHGTKDKPRIPIFLGKRDARDMS